MQGTDGIFIYLLLINVLTAGLLLVDKVSAKAKLRRIAERTILVAMALGGSPAGGIAMRVFNHKVSKWRRNLWFYAARLCGWLVCAGGILWAVL